jgi:hypothetical protein
LQICRVINEAFAGSVPLGLSRPQTVGGVMGSQFEEGFGDDDDEDEDEKYDGQQTHDEGDDEDFDDDDWGGDEGLEGDLVGSSGEDEGPDKNWPPDSEEDADGQPTPDMEMLPGEEIGDEEGDDDFLASLGAGAGGEPTGGAGFGDEEGDDLASALAGGMGGPAQEPDLGGDDMGFLDDMPMDLLGRERAGGAGRHTTESRHQRRSHAGDHQHNHGRLRQRHRQHASVAIANRWFTGQPGCLQPGRLRRGTRDEP